MPKHLHRRGLGDLIAAAAARLTGRDTTHEGVTEDSPPLTELFTSGEWPRPETPGLEATQTYDRDTLRYALGVGRHRAETVERVPANHRLPAGFDANAGRPWLGNAGRWSE